MFTWSDAEFKEFKLRLKFKPRLKFDWFCLKLYLIFQGLIRRSFDTGFRGFETRLKFIKFGHRLFDLAEELILFLCNISFSGSLRKELSAIERNRWE